MRLKIQPASMSRPAVLEPLEGRQLCSVAAAISSGKLIVTGDSLGNDITIEHKGTATLVNGKSFADSAVTKGIEIQPGTASNSLSATDRVTIRSTAKPVDIYSSVLPQSQIMPTRVVVGNNGDGSQVKAAVTLHAIGATLLSVDGSTNNSGKIVSLDYSTVKGGTVSGLTPVPVSYSGPQLKDLSVALGGGNDVVWVNNTMPAAGITAAPPSVSIDAGLGENTIRLRRTAVLTNWLSHASTLIYNEHGGNDNIIVGMNGRLDQVSGILSIGNANGRSSITFDDSATSTAKEWDFGSGYVHYGKVGDTSLSVSYDVNSTAALTLQGGSGGNIFTVRDTWKSADKHTNSTTYLRTGTGSDTVNILETTGALDLDGQNGHDHVTIGDPKYGNNYVMGSVTVRNHNAFTDLLIDNTASYVQRLVQLTAGGTRSMDLITGMAPATILYDASDVSKLTLTTGRGNDIVRVLGTSARATTYINTGEGTDVIEVGNLSNSLDDLNGPLVLDAGIDNDAMYLNDSGALKAQTYSYFGQNLFLRSGAASVTYFNFEQQSLFKSKKV